MTAQLLIGSRVVWALAWLLAVAASVSYLLWPGQLSWWITLLLLLPLLALVLWRLERSDDEHRQPGASDGGVWAPPSDSGGP